MRNYEYAKLINGQPVYADLPIHLEADITVDGIVHPAGGSISTNRADVFLLLGYKRVIYTDAPVREGYYYTPTWTQDDTIITQGWMEHENPPDETTDMIEALEMLGVTDNG